MKRTLLALCCLLYTVASLAQSADTLMGEKHVAALGTPKLSCGYDHGITLRQCVAPASLYVSGAIISAVPAMHLNIDVPLRDWTQRDGHERFEIENGIQYIPIAAPLLLKACGLESRHGWRDLICLEAGTVLVTTLLGNSLKYGIATERPYGGVFNSFPSGHTYTAFMGAEILRREYGEEYPGIAIAGYTVATGVGLMRIYNNRHWASDVLAGAGIGILSASLTYWLAPYLTF